MKHVLHIWLDYSQNSELPCSETMCRNCDRFGNCFSVRNATKYYVSEFGNITRNNNGTEMVLNMMIEIYARGPISCYMYAHSADFDNYKGGIITNNITYPYITHAISIVGWGQQGNLPYWIVRNSFGTTWGETGWFLIERGTNCLLIETECGWAVPSLKPTVFTSSDNNNYLTIP